MPHEETAAAVVEYLKANAPHIAELILKEQPSAGDTHATTALGNQKGSKRISFAEAMKAGKGKKRPVDDEVTMKSADWSLPVEIMKTDPDQQLVFGWASVASKDGLLVVDKQGDMILPEDLERAAYDFVLYCRSQGDMHKTDDNGQPLQVGRVVESMMFTRQKQEVLKIDLGMEGWWVGMRVDSPEVWAAIKRGDRPEFSIGGRGNRVAV